MSGDTPAKQGPSAEYLVIVALVMGIGALGTDLMLPGMGGIAETFALSSSADAHQIVTQFFFGMAVGQIFAGPLSDTFGRKPVIIIGYVFFCAATLVSVVTSDWTTMLVARFVQGLAAAAPRIVIMAMIRDDYAGRMMAQVMSVVGAVFITVPVFAPAIGQGFMLFGGWRAAFGGLCLLAMASALWFALRLPETLAPPERTPFRACPLIAGMREVLTSRIAVGYTVACGFVYGLLVAYLGTAQQVFEAAFGVTDAFAFYFGLGAASVGVSSLINAKLVLRVGMRRLSAQAAAAMALLGIGYGALVLYQPEAGLWPFMLWLIASFFCIGILFANLNALAMEPLGHVAGIGAAFVGALSTFISLPLAALIANQFDGTVRPIVIGFAALAAIAWAVTLWTNRA